MANLAQMQATTIKKPKETTLKIFKKNQNFMFDKIII